VVTTFMGSECLRPGWFNSGYGIRWEQSTA